MNTRLHLLDFGLRIAIDGMEKVASQLEREVAVRQ